MKQKLPLLILLFIWAVSTYAQRYSNSLNANISAGITTEGFRLSMGTEKFLTEKSSIWLSITMNNRDVKFTTSDFKANITDWQIGSKYSYYLVNINDMIYPYISAGAFLGYESMNNRNEIPPTFIVSHQNKLIYGINGAVGTEINFNNISVIVAVDPAYDFSYKHWNTAAIAGLKYYF